MPFERPRIKRAPVDQPGRAAQQTYEKESRPTMPLVEVARTRTKSEALAALEEWKALHPDVAGRLEASDVLVDGMRGSSSLWYRVRVNLQHVPEAERPPQGELIADYDPWSPRR